MTDIYEDFGMKPDFIPLDNSFKVVLPNINYKSPEENNSDKQVIEIINFLKKNKKIRRQNIDELLKVSATRSKEILSQLIEANIIEKVGSGRSVYYILK